MNIILAESSRYPIGSFIDEIRTKFPRGSIVSCTKNNYQEVIDKINKPPVMTDGWLVLININRLDESRVSSFSRLEYNVNVYICRSREELVETSFIFDSLGFNYKVIDNLNPRFEVLVNYIQNELEIDERLASYIVNRHKRNLNKIYESVEILRTVGKIDRSIISKYTQASSDVSFNQLVKYILGVDLIPEEIDLGLGDDRRGKRRINHSKVVKLVYRYKYGLDFLVKFIVTQLEYYLKVYDIIHSGELSLVNYLDYYEKNKKDLGRILDYQLKDIIKAYSYLSYDKLYHIYWLYKREQDKGPTLTGVLGLLRISK